ncbi:MAG: choice-of-anchor J domain-containing protein [Bacteroidales bacterium]|nr:choice-of-anchor J domain-containing protein [Bacteroidales bacterium]
MKHIRKFLAGLTLIAASVAITSCVKGDFDEPPIYIPTVDFDANTTISELKASYTGFRLIEEDIIIKGVVVANDESGNLYKKLILQDENSGIELALDRTNLYNEFQLGQRVYVKCKGMYIGDYNNLVQLGYLFDGGIGRLPEVFIPNHLFRDSLPGNVPEPQVTALNALNYSLLSKLVKFENVSFAEPGAEWAPQSAEATNRTMSGAGGSIVVRTSKYSNFSSLPVPAGSGDVTGILSIFGSTYQLTIRDTSDVQNFGGTVPPPPGGGDGSKENPYSVAQALQKQNATPYVVGFVKGYIVGSVKSGVTNITSADDIHFAAPFTSATNVLIADTSIETNYMNCVIVNLPAGSSLRTEVNLLDNPENIGKWLNVKGTLRTYFGIGGIRDFSGEAGDFEFEGGGGGGGGNSIFLEDFNTNLGTFTAYSVSGDQVWGWGNFDGGCAVMSGFVTPTSYVNEDWLISPAISLPGQTGVTMNFREAINYITSINDLKVFISTNYDGTSNPSTNGTWTELTGFTRAAGNNWTFVNSGDVSLAAYEGQTVRIAFKYISSASASSTWEISRVEVK